MLSFRVFGLPRSGTTWAANWLTTNESICWHDPCEWAGPCEVEAWARDRLNAGISCTGLWLRDDWRTDVPTLFLLRDPEEVQRSLQRVGIPPLPAEVFERFDAAVAGGQCVTLQQLLDPDVAERVQDYLLPTIQFNRERHAQLARMNVQPSAAELARVRAAITRTGGL